MHVDKSPLTCRLHVNREEVKIGNRPRAGLNGDLG
jgi:hypothetical protein